MGQNRGKGGAILTSNELVFPFVDSYVCANFGENRSRNATVRVLADGQTDRQTQTDFIICLMLFAIAMGQIVIMPVAKSAKFFAFIFDQNSCSFEMDQHS